MWQGFTIALREGIESFLIVALTLAYLKRTARATLARAVALGIGASLAVCAVAAFLLSKASNQPLWEGILAGVSALLVGSFLVYMLRTAGTFKAAMERRLEAATGGAGSVGFWGVFLFTVLMITREGMETTLLIATALFQIKSASVLVGLGMGLVAAAAVAFTWTRLGRRVSIGALLTVSAAFLSVFLLQLVLYAVHELSEANVLPNARAIHDATEILGPDGRIGHALTWLLALVPTVWLLAAFLSRKPVMRVSEPSPRRSAPAAARR
jgi:high-affinity iron transporter